jgi:hypothetical protein
MGAGAAAARAVRACRGAVSRSSRCQARERTTPDNKRRYNVNTNAKRCHRHVVGPATKRKHRHHAARDNSSAASGHKHAQGCGIAGAYSSTHSSACSHLRQRSLGSDELQRPGQDLGLWPFPFGSQPHPSLAGATVSARRPDTAVRFRRIETSCARLDRHTRTHARAMGVRAHGWIDGAAVMGCSSAPRTRGRLWAPLCTCHRSGCSAKPIRSRRTSGPSVRTENHSPTVPIAPQPSAAAKRPVLAHPSCAGCTSCGPDNGARPCGHGRAETVGAAAIYTSRAGLVLLECCTGLPPFVLDRAQSFFDLSANAIEKTPQAPPHCSEEFRWARRPGPIGRYGAQTRLLHDAAQTNCVSRTCAHEYTRKHTCVAHAPTRACNMC